MAYAAELDTFYYHAHFTEMLGFSSTVYHHCLREGEHDLLRRFNALPMPAQCLYIRMVNRKTDVFSTRNLQYAEIDAIADVMELLLRQGFARYATADDYFACLLSLSKPALLDLAGDSVKPSWDKKRLAAAVMEAKTFDIFTGGKNIFIRPCFQDEVAYLLYLYFGKMQQNLTGFALRDLGVIRAHEKADYAARFRDAAEAQSSFFYKKLSAGLRLATPAQMEGFAATAKDFPPAQTTFVRRLRDNALLSLGQYFERRKEMAQAIDIYALGDSGDCRERYLRLIYAAGRHEEAQALLENMLADPANDEEHVFAEDFYARKYGKSRIGAHTRLLRGAAEIAVDDIYRGSPEQGAVDYFLRDGWQAHHTENGLWVTLFALFFWEELFETAASISSPFEHYPSSLRQNRFPDLFAREIAALLPQLQAGAAREIIAAKIAAHHSKPNGLFYWTSDLAAFLDDILATMPAAALAVMIEKMAANFEATSDGFPDLVLLKDKVIKFIEIKAEGDQIQRHQLTRIRQMQQAGFDVGITRVAYRFDPEQVFVVVDVETTGGRAASERVTEIGAVKIQGGKVIGEWQSLINPGRRIPYFITELTGISDEMVADAPKFEDIAADFKNFMQGAIFAAHNVNFDYGFIAEEYKRLELDFRYPKICTCTGMRRHYPGHGSYGLAAICREYGVSLKSHHRALCDAQAAAELLLLINEKRAAAQQPVDKPDAERIVGEA